jgi:hypothetical protein
MLLSLFSIACGCVSTVSVFHFCDAWLRTRENEDEYRGVARRFLLQEDELS